MLLLNCSFSSRIFFICKLSQLPNVFSLWPLVLVFECNILQYLLGCDLNFSSCFIVSVPFLYCLFPFAQVSGDPGLPVEFKSETFSVGRGARCLVRQGRGIKPGQSPEPWELLQRGTILSEGSRWHMLGAPGARGRGVERAGTSLTPPLLEQNPALMTSPQSTCAGAHLPATAGRERSPPFSTALPCMIPQTLTRSLPKQLP